VATPWPGCNTVTITDPSGGTPGKALPIAIGVSVLSWLYLLGGAGTGMNIWAMSTPLFPPFDGPGHMSAPWTGLHALRMAGMWWTMMMAMMGPGLIVLMLRQPGRWRFSPGFLVEYALPWLVFSLAATGLQFGLEQAGWLDGMRMWSTNSSLSRVLLALAALSQVWWLMHPDKSPFCVQGGSAESGTHCGISCVGTTGPVMLLLFAGGVMNLYWIAALTLWNMAWKAWPQTRLLPLITLSACLVLAWQA